MSDTLQYLPVLGTIKNTSAEKPRVLWSRIFALAALSGAITFAWLAYAFALNAVPPDRAGLGLGLYLGCSRGTSIFDH